MRARTRAVRSARRYAATLDVAERGERAEDAKRKVAISASPSELVFPKADGSMMRRDVNLEHTLAWPRAIGTAPYPRPQRRAR
jgi:hypothetical protein